jgi:phage terminase large subunit-like protein
MGATRQDSSAPAELEEAIRLLPGYDPYAETGGAEFVPEKALHAIEFFQRFLTHVKGPLGGQRLILEPWQMAIIGNLFGWIRPDGTRRYREGLVYVPRGNGKTTLSAGIPLYVLFCEDERGKEIYASAADREQATILFHVARDMVLAEPELKKRSKVLQKSITRENEGSFFRAISSDANTKHGFNASCVVIDELHAQPDRDLVDVLETSMGKRPQPILLSLTTADFDRPIEESICNEKHKYASDVRDGLISDPAFLPAIYEATADDDWKDPAVHLKANPNYGVSVVVDDFERKFKKALSQPSFENTFRRLHLDQKTGQDVRWLSLTEWDACGGALERDSLRGRPCSAGFDLASTSDIAAFVLYFPEDGGAVLPFFWVPRENAEDRERKSRHATYVSWSRRGLIELTPGNVIDHDFILGRIAELARIYRIRHVGVDPWNARGHVMTTLGSHGLRVLEFQQSFPVLSAPTKKLEVMVLSRRLRHGGNEILRWMASNMAVEEDFAGNVKPSKKKSTEKIDGIVALIMAIAVAELEEGTGHPYNTRGFYSI